MLFVFLTSLNLGCIFIDMAKKKTTIDDLARMVAKGFDSVENKMATKEALGSLRSEMNRRFDKVENIILIDHKRRIEKLELDIKELKNALAM